MKDGQEKKVTLPVQEFCKFNFLRLQCFHISILMKLKHYQTVNWLCDTRFHEK